MTNIFSINDTVKVFNFFYNEQTDTIESEFKVGIVKNIKQWFVKVGNCHLNTNNALYTILLGNGKTIQSYRHNMSLLNKSEVF
jgi:hypothetical protein